MSILEFFDKPIVTTLISLIGVSFVAAYISERWQRRSKMYDLKLNQIREIISAYHHYLRLVKGDVNDLNGKPFDEIHALVISLNKLNKCMFKSEKIYPNWDYVFQNLSSIRNDRIHSKEINWDERIDPLREKADEAIDIMFKELI
ncbi:MAG: hypothetical protein HOO91_13650 [Bacteroidales bacterium]|nr:hypothetical protein [Bacteroidales bacterium]